MPPLPPPPPPECAQASLARNFFTTNTKLPPVFGSGVMDAREARKPHPYRNCDQLKHRLSDKCVHKHKRILILILISYSCTNIHDNIYKRTHKCAYMHVHTHQATRKQRVCVHSLSYQSHSHDTYTGTHIQQTSADMATSYTHTHTHTHTRYDLTNSVPRAPIVDGDPKFVCSR
jgi:hypothetical protein